MLLKMKKSIIFTMIFALIASMAGTFAFADSNDIKIIIDGEEVKSDVAPQLVSGRTLVPIRVISETLGADVTWDQKNRVVFINSSTDVSVGNSSDIQLVINGEVIKTDVPPQLIDNRTLVPIRVVSEELNADVKWDQSARTVTIVSGEESSTPTTPSDGIAVPNKEEEEFILHDDDLFIFVENFKLFETPGVKERVIEDALNEQFPDYNIRFVIWSKPVRTDELLAVGVTPDIYIGTTRTHMTQTLKKHDWHMDMTDLIAEYDIDMDAFNQGAVEMIKSRSDGLIYGVPWFINEFVMYYNKKHLDAFEEEYPKNGMTYDELYEWLPDITGQAGVLTLKGITQHPDHYLDFNQLGLYPFEPGDKEELTKHEIRDSVNITTDEWLYLVENMYRFLTLPGNNYNAADDFFRRGNYTLGINTIDELPLHLMETDFIKSGDIHWYEQWSELLDIGIASVPVLSEENNWIYQPNMYSMSVTKQSDKKEQSMEVIKWMASEEGQLQISRNGLKAVLETDEVVNQFGADIPSYAKIDGLAEAVYWGENAHVQNYENTEWPSSGFPLWHVFRLHVLQNGSGPETALQNAERDIYEYYLWDE